MSASVFNDCIGNAYETYPSAKHINGEVSFGELKKGDSLFYLDIYNNLVEMKVIKGWHVSDSRCLISVNDNYFKTICFGSANCWNVSVKSKDSSILFYNGCIIGTNKNSVISERKRVVESDIEYAKKHIEALEMVLETLNTLG